MIGRIEVVRDTLGLYLLTVKVYVSHFIFFVPDPRGMKPLFNYWSPVKKKTTTTTRSSVLTLSLPYSTPRIGVEEQIREKGRTKEALSTPGKIPLKIHSLQIPEYFQRAPKAFFSKM